MFRMGKNIKHIATLSTKQIYRLLMKMGYENKFGKHTGTSCLEYWNKIFTFKIKNRIENKFGHFQYNLLYNLIPCKKNLYKWKIIDSDKCCFCDCLEDCNHFSWYVRKMYNFGNPSSNVYTSLHEFVSIYP